MKYKRPEVRGGKPFLSGKSWKTTHDPWRGISRTSFGLDYLRQYPCPKDRVKREQDYTDKMFELNYYDQEDQPRYGFDVFVQRISCYIQHKESAQNIPEYLESPYQMKKTESDPHRYMPQLETLDNGNTIIIFGNSSSGSIEDTLISARQHWESRWRRLPFYLAYESHDISNDDTMAVECMKIILADVFKSVVENWESFLDVCNTHVSILEEKIYEQPADESRAPELWTNSSMWLKVERLIAIHLAVVKEMQANLREFLTLSNSDDNWLEASPDDMEKIRQLTQDDLKQPTAALGDLMYKSVGIRDSRHGLQLNTSMWRLRYALASLSSSACSMAHATTNRYYSSSWITFIFLPLTFISSFFGMNVDIFQSSPGYPSIRWYFASALPMMVLVLVFWYFIKHFLARRRQTPYSRGIYEHLFFELATAYPRLWSRSGPLGNFEPQSTLDRVKWRLIIFWNDSAKTILAGTSAQDAEYDDLGAWSRFKRTLTRRWTSQIRVESIASPPSSITLEEGSNDDSVSGRDKVEESKPRIVRTSVTGGEPGGMLEVPSNQMAFMRMQSIHSRPPTADSITSSNRNSGIMVEEEPSDWLRDFGVKPSDGY